MKRDEKERNYLRIVGGVLLALVVIIGIFNIVAWLRQRERTTRIDTLVVFSDNTVSKPFLSESLDVYLANLPPNTRIDKVRIEALSTEGIVDAIGVEPVQPDIIVGTAKTIAAIRAEHGEAYFGTSGALIPRIVAAERTILACQDGVLDDETVNLVDAMEQAGQIGMSDPVYFDTTASILIASDKEQATVYNYSPSEARELVSLIESHAVVRPTEIGAQELDAIGGMLGRCVVVEESQALASEDVTSSYTLHELQFTQWQGLYVAIVRDRPLGQKQALLSYIEDVLFSTEWQERFSQEGVTGVKQNLSSSVASTLISVNDNSVEVLREALGGQVQ